MGVIPKQDIGFVFGAVQQARSKRDLRPGEIVEALNVRLVKDGEMRKRYGFDRVVPAAGSGSVTAPWESFVSDGRSQLARDAADVVWRRDGSTWRTRGTAKRALPTLYPSTLVASARRPVAVAVGTNWWVFTLGATSSYTLTIFDADGNVTMTPLTITATNIASLAAETDGTNVWVVWVTATGGVLTMTSHKFVIASPTASPTSATYRTCSQAPAGVDMHRLANGDIVVACSEFGGAAACNLSVSYLDTATGQAKAAPAAVTTSVGNVAGGNQLGPSAPSILVSDGSSGSFYVAMWTTRASVFGGTSSGQRLLLSTITAATLAHAAGTNIATVSDAAQFVIGWCCGYVDGGGNRIVYYSSDSYPIPPVAEPRPYALSRYSSASGTSTTIRRYSFPVSKPQAIGSSWYLLTGFDDGPATNFQKSYFVIDSDGNILSQVAYGQAAAAGLQADNTLPQLGPAGTLVQGLRTFATPLRASGNKLQCALLLNTGSGGGAGGANDYAPALAAIDLAATYAAPVRARDGVAIWPGGVPVLAGTSDNQREIALMLSPVNATFTAGAGAALAGPTTVQYVYRMVDSDGTIYRSAPSPAQTQTFNNGGGSIVTVKPLTHLMPGATAQIEVYLSVVSSTEPFLHTTVANDPTVDTIAVSVTPSTISDAETIYTYGGGIENAPVPPSRAVAMFRNRTLLASGREIWPSLESEDGLGPRFNEAFVTTWDEGEGDILAMAAVDWNYCAVFKRDAIGVISGGGPIPTAGGGVAGNYEVQTLRARKPVNVSSVVTGPQGAYFQSTADGRIYCVNGLDVIDVSQGMEDYRTETVVAASWVEKDRQLHFHTDAGAILVLDYAHPSPEQPAGRWLRWYTTGLARAAGATIDTSGVPVHLERTSGAIRTPGTTFQDATSGTAVDVLMTVTTGDLAAAGQIRGEYRLDAVHVEGEFLAQHNLRVTVTSDYGSTATPHTASVGATPQTLYIRPGGHDRTRSTRIKLEELVYSAAYGAGAYGAGPYGGAGSIGEGFIFHAVVLTIQPFGRAAFPSNSRRVV